MFVRKIVVIGCRVGDWGRGSGEKKLMGGIARSLIGLEHVIGEPILLGELKVWIQDAMNPVKCCIRNIAILRAILIVGIRTRGKSAPWHRLRRNIAGTVHFAPVVHGNPRGMYVSRIGTNIDW